MLKQAVFVVALSLSLTTGALADQTTLAHWTFEVSQPSGSGSVSGPYAAEAGIFAATSMASGFHASTATTWSSAGGNGSSRSFNSNNWSAGDYYQFTTTTLGYESITLSWDQTRSPMPAGPSVFELQWSNDGVNFNALFQYNISSIAWSPTYQPGSTFGPVSLPETVADQELIYVRFVSAQTTEPFATNRVDNIVISGTLIPAPSALALLSLAGMVGARRRRDWH